MNKYRDKNEGVVCSIDVSLAMVLSPWVWWRLATFAKRGYVGNAHPAGRYLWTRRVAAGRRLSQAWAMSSIIPTDSRVAVRYVALGCGGVSPPSRSEAMLAMHTTRQEDT